MGIRLWEAFYKGLSSDRSLRENIRFMSTFHQWTISECQAVVREFESFGQPKATNLVTKPAAPAASAPAKPNASRKTPEYMEIDQIAAPGKTQKKKTTPTPAPAAAAFSGGVRICCRNSTCRRMP